MPDTFQPRQPPSHLARSHSARPAPKPAMNILMPQTPKLIAQTCRKDTVKPRLALAY